ncbi:MAG: transposase family protein, partial [Carnobacterium sp.]
MSHNNCIQISLDLKDKNITFEEKFCEEKRIKGFKSKIFFATLTYNPSHCERCGQKNEAYSIVKNGYLTSRVKWISPTHYPTYIQLKKQRFLCRKCETTFVACSSEVDQNCFIAKRVKQSIAVELADTLSVKDLSRRHFVSPTTVGRVLDQLNDSVK